MSVANLNDMATLITDPTFGNRILMSLTQFCTLTVPNESVASTASACQTHITRKNYAAQILNNPNAFKSQFINAVGANQTVANDATASGTIVGQTGATLANSALLCTDTDINNAVAAAFNAFVAGI